MNYHDAQRGSGHIVLIIAAVVVILGGLGFVLWNNFLRTPAASTSSTTSTSSTNTSDSTGASIADMISIPEWGIKGPTSGVAGLKYKIGTVYNMQSLVFTTPILEADSECGVGYAPAITRYEGTAVANIGAGSAGNPEATAAEAYETMAVPNTSYVAKARIGDYYFFVLRPQAVCDSATAEIDAELGVVFAATREFILNAETE